MTSEPENLLRQHNQEGKQGNYDFTAISRRLKLSAINSYTPHAIISITSNADFLNQAIPISRNPFEGLPKEGRKLVKSNFWRLVRFPIASGRDPNSFPPKSNSLELIPVTIQEINFIVYKFIQFLLLEERLYYNDLFYVFLCILA